MKINHHNSMPLPLDPPKGQSVQPVIETPQILGKMTTDGVDLKGKPKPTGEPPIQAQNMSVKLVDSNGFLNFGADDLKATLSGDVTVSKSFILDKLGNLPEIPDLVFKPPEFDAERKQFVIKGKAEDKILGFIDIGFEIRLAAKDGKLAFRIDNGIKRGIAYKILAKQLKKQGVSTQKIDKHLHILPELNREIAIPLGKDKSQKGEIKAIQATPEQLNFEITESGELKISLKDVNLNISSQQGGSTTAAKAADTADLKFMLAMDDNLTPHIELHDADIDAKVQTERLGELIKKPAILTQIQKELGGSAELSLKDVKGDITLGKNMSVQVDGDLNLTGDGTHHFKTDFDIQTESKTIGIDLSNTSVSTQSLEKANLESASVTLVGKNITGEFTGQIEGKIPESLGSAEFSTAGKHTLSLKEGQLTANVDKVTLDGEVKIPKKQVTAETTDKKPMTLDVKINQLEADANISLGGDHTVKAQITEGGVQLSTKGGLEVTSDAKIKGSITGSKANGTLEGQGLKLNQANGSPLEVSLDQANLDGGFQNGKGLAIDGKVIGKVALQATADIAIQSEGYIEAHVSTGGGKVTVDGTVKTLDLSIGKAQNIDLKATGLNLATAVKNKKNTIEITSQGESAVLNIDGKQVKVDTENVESTLNLGIGKNVNIKGKTGDAHLKIDGKSIKVDAEDAVVTGDIGNKQKNIDVHIEAKADVTFGLEGKDNITIQSHNAETEVDFKLKAPKTGDQKVAVEATGGDFKLGISGGNIDVTLQEAQFEGDITPNAKMDIDVKNTHASQLDFQLKDPKDKSGTDVHISSKTPLEGSFSVEDKVTTDFKNGDGFSVDVSSGKVAIQVDDLTIEGDLNTPKAKAHIKGQGDLDLDLINKGPVHIDYDGEFSGHADLPETIESDFNIKGPISAEINKKDVDIKAEGFITIDNQKSDGTSAKLSIPNRQEALEISIRDKAFGLSLKEEGFLDIRNLKSLTIKQAPELAEILEKFESNDVSVSYKNLSVGNNGKDIALTLKSEEVALKFGNVTLGMSISKEGKDLEIPQGHLSFEPNITFYEVLENSLSEKFGINIKGKPSFENGEIRIRGEARTPSGITQLADFHIKATVKDNKLVLDMDKAEVLGMMGSNTTGKVVKYFLDKTDIDIFKDSQTLEISLGDIVKDLSLTKGINFTSLELKGNRFEVGFYSSKMDQRIAKLAAKNDIEGMKTIFREQGIGPLSRESMATLYDALIKDSDTDLANQMTQQVTQAYLGAFDDSQKQELEQALMWIAKNKPAKKADINDNLALDFFKNHSPSTAEGKKNLKALPKKFVLELADNLDKTWTQGGGWSMISPAERRIANEARELLGVKPNKRVF